MKQAMVTAGAVARCGRDPGSMSCGPVLPEELAPALVERVERLLAEVATTSAPRLTVALSYRGPRCIVCHEGGKLGGHHDESGQVQWIHRTCHRRLHRRGRIRQAVFARIQAAAIESSLSIGDPLVRP